MEQSTIPTIILASLIVTVFFLLVCFASDKIRERMINKRSFRIKQSTEYIALEVIHHISAACTACSFIVCMISVFNFVNT